MRANFRMNCIPESMLDGEVPDFEDFLEKRRHLMAMRIKKWFETLWIRIFKQDIFLISRHFYNYVPVRVAPDVLKDKITPKEEEFPTRFTDSLLFSSFMIYVVFRL